MHVPRHDMIELEVIPMIFACDNCHYLFSEASQPEQCPDCGKYTVRPANADETQEWEARMAEKAHSDQNQ